MSEWQRMRLGEVVHVKHGFAFPGTGFEDTDSGPQVLTPGNFALGGGFQRGKPKAFIGDYPPEYLLAAGDVIVTMTDLSKKCDTLGLPAVIPEDGRYLHNQRIGLLEITDPAHVDRGFLNYYLRTSSYRAHVIGTASGSTVRHTSPGRIHEFVACLPPLREQRAIAEVLGALDDKIAANRKVASTAMELAEAQFRVSRAGGAEARLGDVATLNYGKALPQTIREPGDVLVYGSGGVVGRHSSALVDHAGVVVGRKGTVGAVYWAPVAYFPIDTTYSVALKGDSVSIHYLYFALKAMKLESLNGDSAVPGLNRNEAYAQPLLVPARAEVEAFTSTCSVLFDRIACADAENEQLAKTRDGLLPLLMSGKLRVKDAEKRVGEVV